MKAWVQWLAYPVVEVQRHGRPRFGSADRVEGLAWAVPCWEGYRVWLVNKSGSLPKKPVRKLALNLWDLSTGQQVRRHYTRFRPPSWMADPLLRAIKSASVPEGPE